MSVQSNMMPIYGVPVRDGGSLPQSGRQKTHHHKHPGGNNPGPVHGVPINPNPGPIHGVPVYPSGGMPPYAPSNPVSPLKPVGPGGMVVGLIANPGPLHGVPVNYFS